MIPQCLFSEGFKSLENFPLLFFPSKGPGLTGEYWDPLLLGPFLSKCVARFLSAFKLSYSTSPGFSGGLAPGVVDVLRRPFLEGASLFFLPFVGCESGVPRGSFFPGFFLFPSLFRSFV